MGGLTWDASPSYSHNLDPAAVPMASTALSFMFALCHKSIAPPCTATPQPRKHKRNDAPTCATDKSD